MYLGGNKVQYRLSEAEEHRIDIELKSCTPKKQLQCTLSIGLRL